MGWTLALLHRATRKNTISGEGLDAYFDAIVLGPPVRWLIDNNFLAEYRLFSIPGVDMSGAHTRMGEYVTADAEQAMDKPAITGDIVKHWKKYASDKLTIGFAPSLKLSKKFAAAFNSAGIPAAHLDGTTSKEVRFETLQQFALGNIRVVFNQGLFGEGFDISANSGMDVTIGCVIDAAPTQAVGMWLQRCGRGLRKQVGKAIILDHASNAMTHGLPCQEREWSLTSEKRSKKQDDEADLLMTQCEVCFSCYTPTRFCPECGHEKPIQERKIDEKDGDLVEVTAELERQKELEEIQKKQDRMNQGRAVTVDDLVKLGKSPSAAIKIVRARDEKRCLQMDVFNICDLHMGLSTYEIQCLKPKPMKLLIEENGRAGFNAHVVVMMINNIKQTGQ